MFYVGILYIRKLLLLLDNLIILSKLTKRQQSQKHSLGIRMIIYIIQCISLLIFTIGLVWYFSHESTPLYVRLLVIFSFNLSFIYFLILPMDIYESSISEQISISIRRTWIVIYYLNFMLCWIVLPIVQEYQYSGEFTKIGKFKQAIRTNAILMLAILIGGIILMIYLIITGKFKISQIPSLFATIVNIFGMCLISVMLGFGLVSFPKQNYLKIDYRRRVSKCHRMASTLTSQQQFIKQQLYDIVKILQIRKQTVSNLSDGHQLEILELIQSKIDFNNFRTYADPNQHLPSLSNAALNTITKKRIIQYNACQSQLDQLVDQLRQVSQSFSKNNYSRNKILYIILFVITTIISLIIFLAETSTFISVFNYVNILGIITFSSPASYIMNCLLIMYIAYIVTHTVFRIKVNRVFSLHKKNSSSSSLTFTAINMARICYPLCYNYLQLTQISNKNIAFLSFFGQIQIHQKFIFIFPIIMIIFGIFNLLDIYDTIMGYLGLGSLIFDQDDQKQKNQEGQKILSERLKQRNIQNHKMEMIQLL